MKKQTKIIAIVLLAALVITCAALLGHRLTNSQTDPSGAGSKSDTVTESQTKSQSESQTESSSETESSTQKTAASSGQGKVSAGLFTTTEQYRASHTYCIAVNTAQNIVIIYGKDADGNYTKPVKALVASCGKDSSPTKLGTYYTSEKLRWHALNGNVYGQYVTRISGPYLFHSVPYYKKSPDTLEWEEFNKLGQRASAGCVRLQVKDSKWIYDHCELGTCVYLYSDASRKEPLSKPTAPKIPANSPNRDWDPTDPDPNNPWNK
ncbi:MAG TPA: L,D-transpeptidase [Clostridiales bacterium]|nr:L,D-transpeptidase [Clostridiales bacterium]